MRRVLAIATAVILTIASTGHAYAVTYTSDDAFYNGNNIMFYSSTEPTICSSNAGAGQTTTDEGNIPTAYNFFIKKGLSPLAASAVVGNFMQESGVNPRAQNGIGAYGIAQWLNGRKTNLLALDNHDTLEAQLNYVWIELNGGYKSSLAILKKPPTTDPSKLAIRFGGGPDGANGGYEGYGSDETGKRGEYAAQIFAQYGGGGGTTTGTSGTCDNTGAGDFIYFSQNDTKWKNDPYGSGTVGVDGCGPTSVAMIVATFFDKTVTPDVIAKLGASNGSYIPGTGTSHYKLLDAAKKKYGLKYIDMTDDDVGDLINYVKDGNLVYLAGSGPPPFTSKGHITVMRGVTADGKIIIADPYRGESDTYDASVIQAYKGSTFGIEKP